MTLFWGLELYRFKPPLVHHPLLWMDCLCPQHYSAGVYRRPAPGHFETAEKWGSPVSVGQRTNSTESEN